MTNEISMFIPCLVDIFLPHVGEAMASVLRRAGVNPVYHLDQTCCGQPAMNSGYRKEAADAAKHFIEIFGDDEYIVSPSGSCVHTVKHRYPELLSDEPQWLRRAEEMAPRIFELSQFLVDVLKVTDLGARFRGTVAYHESCHVLRGLGVTEQPRKLIAAVKGAEMVSMKQEEFCCGFGGIFSNSYPEISGAMVHDKVTSYLECGADLLLLSEPGCLLNIGGFLSRNHPGKKAMHLANFLDLKDEDGDK